MKRSALFVLAAFGIQGAAVGQTLTVFAAASLREPFSAIAKSFEKARPGVHVVLNFAGSQQLAASIKLGAPADVIASAGPEPLRTLAIPGSDWRIFAENQLAIVVPAGSKTVQSLRDLSKPMKLVIADRRVPVGTYTVQMLGMAAAKFGARFVQAVEGNVVSKEQDVRAVLAKVELGEADAGIVYVSDAAVAKGRVRTVAIPEDLNPVARYPAAMVGSTTQKHLAMGFIHFLFEPKSQMALTGQGFISPVAPTPNLAIGDGSIPWSKIAGMAMVTVQATGEDGKPHPYRGVDLRTVLAAAHVTVGGKTVVISAADTYMQQFKDADVEAGHLVLTPMKDGNWRVVVVGQKPKVWVMWVRRIDFR